MPQERPDAAVVIAVVTEHRAAVVAVETTGKDDHRRRDAISARGSAVVVCPVTENVINVVSLISVHDDDRRCLGSTAAGTSVVTVVFLLPQPVPAKLKAAATTNNPKFKAPLHHKKSPLKTCVKKETFRDASRATSVPLFFTKKRPFQGQSASNWDRSAPTAQGQSASRGVSILGNYKRKGPLAPAFTVSSSPF